MPQSSLQQVARLPATQLAGAHTPDSHTPLPTPTPPLPRPPWHAGRTSAPLADLPAWRVEQLTLAGVRDLGLYRAAFTHKSALALEERTEKVGMGELQNSRTPRAAQHAAGAAAAWESGPLHPLPMPMLPLPPFVCRALSGWNFWATACWA